jgi:hypothetical protein
MPQASGLRPRVSGIRAVTGLRDKDSGGGTGDFLPARRRSDMAHFAFTHHQNLKSFSIRAVHSTARSIDFCQRINRERTGR